MYESPIRLLVQQLETSIREQQEKQIFEAIQKCGVYVDRDELIKALAYDRAQYAQGYSDGRADAQRWISVEERLPENDVPVLVSAKRKAWNGKEYSVVFTAFHTDGTTHTEDSGCDWNLEDTGLKYCEESDDYIIPEAWWEDVRYGEEFSKVYETNVTHWMPMPKPPEE